VRRTLLTGVGGLLLVALTATACTSDSEADAEDTSTPTVAAAESLTATATAEATPEAVADAGDMIGALLLIDNAGFHGMDEGLNGEAPEIDAAWLGRAQKARIAAQAVVWAPSTEAAAHAFIEATTALEAALEADDAAAAAPLATAAHETQHELSHLAYEAIEGAPASASGGGAALAALNLVDGAGFHGMDEDLNGGEPIDASWIGKVSRARIAAQAVAWPGESQAAADAFVEAALALEAALEADDAAAAAPLAIAAHETQHTLSGRAYGALKGMRGSAHSNGSILAAMVLIDGAGFHGMDEGLNGGEAIDASWVGKVTRAKQAAQTVGWPEDVQASADAFIAAATALETALTADDAEAAATAAVAAHETQHTLSHDAYAALGGGTSAH
jgi:hypothetical protein